MTPTNPHITPEIVEKAFKESKRRYATETRDVRREKIFRDILTGKSMDRCPAVIDDADRRYWNENEARIRRAREEGLPLDVEGSFDGL